MERDVPVDGDRQQRLQVPAQHHEGAGRRAAAPPHALPAVRSHPALSVAAFPQGQAGGNGDHDQGRGRTDRRLRRGSVRDARVPRRPGGDRAALHHARKFLAVAGRDRGDLGPARYHPQAAQAGAGARARAPNNGAPTGRPRRRSGRWHPRGARQQHLELRARRCRQPPGPHLQHPLRNLPTQVRGQGAQQLSRPGDAVRLLFARRLSRAHRPVVGRCPARGRGRLQGSARSAQGAARLGPAADGHPDQVRAGGPAVQLLREIRDNSLLQTESGSAFMDTFNEIYYSFSPTIADWERESPVFKEAVKIAITPLISSLSLMENANSESEVLGIGISVIALNLAMYIGVPAIIVIGIKKKI